MLFGALAIASSTLSRPNRHTHTTSIMTITTTITTRLRKHPRQVTLTTNLSRPFVTLKETADKKCGAAPRTLFHLKGVAGLAREFVQFVVERGDD